jgi:hypothetical protein
MIFVEYNDHGGRKFTFALDQVATWDTFDGNKTFVTLQNGREEVSNIKFDELVEAIFSDENMVDEYTNSTIVSGFSGSIELT